MIIAYAKGAFLNWRLVSWLNIIYTILPIIAVQLFVPESPVWLVSKGRMEDAAKSLKYLYKNYPQPEHTVSIIEFFFSLVANVSGNFLPIDTNFGRYAFACSST